MKKKMWAQWGVFLLFLLVVGVACFSMWKSRGEMDVNNLKCDPSMVRKPGREAWDKLMGPAKSLPPIDMKIFDTLTSTTETSLYTSPTIVLKRLTIECFATAEPLSRSEVLYTIAPPENGTNISSPSLAVLLAVGVDSEKNYKLPGLSPLTEGIVDRIYPDGTTMTTEQYEKIMGEDLRPSALYVQSRPHQRDLQLLIQLDKSRHARLMWCMIWDHDTKYRFSRNSGAYQGANGLLYLHRYGAYWRGSKVDILLDVAYGQPIVRPLPLTKDAIVDFGVAKVRMIGLLADIDTNSFNFSSENGHRMTRFHLNERKGGTTIFLAVSPACLIPLLEGTVHYKGQKETKRVSVMSCNSLGKIFLDKPAEQIDRIELSLQTQVERKVITLDKLPGMSAANSGVTDLLDVVVPAVDLCGTGDTENFLIDMLMLQRVQNRFSNTSTGAWRSNIQMENVSVRDVLGEYIVRLPEAMININEKKGELQVQSSAKSMM